jgi:hypothetical protein
VATKLDTLLKLSVIAALLFGSSAAGYYYAVYLPERDAQRDQLRLAEALHAYGRQRADVAVAAAEQQQQEQRRAAGKAAAEARYAACLTAASANRDAAWAEACKRLADQAVQNRGDCLANTKLPQGYCNAVYRPRDASAHCILPLKIVTSLDGGLTTARSQCLQQRDAALQ